MSIIVAALSPADKDHIVPKLGNCAAQKGTGQTMPNSDNLCGQTWSNEIPKQATVLGQMYTPQIIQKPSNMSINVPY